SASSRSATSSDTPRRYSACARSSRISRCARIRYERFVSRISDIHRCSLFIPITPVFFVGSRRRRRVVVVRTRPWRQCRLGSGILESEKGCSKGRKNPYECRKNSYRDVRCSSDAKAPVGVADNAGTGGRFPRWHGEAETPPNSTERHRTRQEFGKWQPSIPT